MIRIWGFDFNSILIHVHLKSYLQLEDIVLDGPDQG